MTKAAKADVIEAIERALELEADSLSENTRAVDVKGWDSLGHLSILVALDNLFGGKVAGIQEMAETDSVDKIIALLQRYSLVREG